MDSDDISTFVGVITMVAMSVILAAIIGGFVLDMGDDTGNSNSSSNESLMNEVTINTEKGGISTAVLSVFSGAILFLGKKVWDLNSEMKYLKGKVEALENEGETLQFNSDEVEEEPKQETS